MSEIAYRTASQLNDSMVRVYNYMFLAILISGIVSYFIGTNAELVQFLFTGWVKWIVIFAPLLAMFGIIVAINSNPPKEIALAMLVGFAALMGLSFSSIFAVFTLGSIVMAFMGAAVLFATMSIYGYTTKRDLTSVGQFLFVGLIAVVIASIINIFVGSSVMTMVISAISIIVFTGLTAYDSQKIREMLQVENNGTPEVLGALTLYLDFINLFLSLLQLFGGKKD